MYMSYKQLQHTSKYYYRLRQCIYFPYHILPNQFTLCGADNYKVFYPVITVKNIWIKLHCVKIWQWFAIRDWDMSLNVILQRLWPVMGWNKWHYRIPWSPKHRSGCQNHDFVQKFWSRTSICKMEANVICSFTSHVQTAHDIFYLLKSFYSSYLVLKFGNELPISNRDMAQLVILQRLWLWKVKVIGQNKWHHRIPWSPKHRSRRQNHALVQKLWSRLTFSVEWSHGGKEKERENKRVGIFFLFCYSNSGWF